MPPLPSRASVEIPVIVRSGFKGKEPVGRAPKRRTYNDEPLPVIPSDRAPRNAKITGRVVDKAGVHYSLKIGEVEIDDVGVEEILEYVSALELEDFENAQFVEEGLAQDAVEAAEEEARQEKLERMKHRAKTIGAVFVETDTGTSDDVDGVEEVQGWHGRARPTYTHLFQKTRRRGEKTIISNTDDVDLMGNDEDEALFESEPSARAPVVREAVACTELPPRRRRKRDKVTGELLPLSPVAQAAQAATSEKRKKQRRRRHPLTGTLMPLGWRFDPSNQNDTYESRRSGTSSADRQLSISQERTAKRPKLDTPSEWSRSPSPAPLKPAVVVQCSPATTLRPFRPGNRAGSNAEVLDLLTSDDEPEIVLSPRRGDSSLKSPPTPAQPRSTNNMMRSMALSSAAETSPEPGLRAFLSRPSPSKNKPTLSPVTSKIVSPARPRTPKTSILNPSATRASSTEPILHQEEVTSDDELGDEEFFIEAVLAHSLSDPRTHPAALGNKPVMLYQVKWEGYKDPTWEPPESFTDRSVLNMYRRNAGLPAEPGDEQRNIEEDQDETMGSPNDHALQSMEPDLNDKEESLEEDEYEVEAIVGHQLSDPRTHPSALGKKPVMLYHVKWRGYEDFTWEPASSFEDTVMIQSYIEHYGVADSTLQKAVDKEMGGVR